MACIVTGEGAGGRVRHALRGASAALDSAHHERRRRSDRPSFFLKKSSEDADGDRRGTRVALTVPEDASRRDLPDAPLRPDPAPRRAPVGMLRRDLKIGTVDRAEVWSTKSLVSTERSRTQARGHNYIGP